MEPTYSNVMSKVRFVQVQHVLMARLVCVGKPFTIVNIVINSKTTEQQWEPSSAIIKALFCSQG